MNLPKITKARLTDQVVEILYDKISRGEIKPGEKLPSEAELSVQLGVARPTVREALSRLLGLGLIVRNDYSMAVAENAAASLHARLVPLLLQEWQTQELYEARIFIECDLAILASRKATPEDLVELHMINEQLVDKNIQRGYWELDMEFHYKVAAIAGNEIMMSISRTINDLFRRLRQDVEKLHSDYTETYQKHEELICAIHERDEDKIRAIVTRTLADAEKALVELRHT